MFEFFRELRKSAGEKRQELLAAYLDDALTPEARRRFEQRLAQDETLRLELAQHRWIKENVRRLPRMRAPRHFTLDPVVYGRRRPDLTIRLYPALRTATVLATFIFVVALAAQIIVGASSRGQTADQANEEVAMEAETTLPESEQPAAIEGLAAPAGAAAEAVMVTVEVEPETLVEEAPIEAQAIEETAEPMAEEVVVEEAEAIEAPAPLVTETSKAEEEAIAEQVEPPAEPQPVSPAGGAGDENRLATGQVENLEPTLASVPTSTVAVADETFAAAAPAETKERSAAGEATAVGQLATSQPGAEDGGMPLQEEIPFPRSILPLLVIGSGVLVILLVAVTVIIGRRRW